MENDLKETKQMEFKIDWLSLTIHYIDEVIDQLWMDFFQDHLGKLEPKGHGARGYKLLRIAEKGSKIYSSPTSGMAHFNIELPGSACSCVPPETFKELFTWLKTMKTVKEQDSFRFNVKRIDLAFDNVPFTPMMVGHAIEENRIRSLTQRESLIYTVSPYTEKEDGSGIGQTTVYFGAASSARRIRVYDKRGPTRLELVVREERANAITRRMLTKKPVYWPQIAMTHIQDFIEIYKTTERDELADWWKAFIGGTDRAYMKVNSSPEISLIKAQSWLLNQCSPWISVILATDPEFMERIREEGSHKLKPHHLRVIDSGKRKKRNNSKRSPEW